MAKLPTEILKEELQALQAKVLAQINELLNTYEMTESITKENILRFVNEFDFEGFLDENGLSEITSKYLNSFDDMIMFNKEAVLTSMRLDEIINQTELIKDSVGKYILGKASSYTDILRTNIMQGIMGELTDAQISDNLKLTGLTDAQLNTAIDTSYFNHERSITSEIFSDKPDQRFKYVGSIIKTSSDICVWLMDNQNPDGYTREEIDKGIETPYGIVNWFGRVPNFNCGHRWLPV